MGIIILQMKFATFAVAVAANQFDSMNEDELLVSLESTLSSALSSEARGDGDAAVAKTAAIKNIQKALTARILKRLDDGQPLVEVARKMKAIDECSHKSTIWKEDLVSCNPSNQSSKTPSRPSKRSLMSEVWARSEQLAREPTSRHRDIMFNDNTPFGHDEQRLLTVESY